MNKLIIAALLAIAACFGTALLLRAQDKPVAKYEYAIVKWEEDRSVLNYYLPGKKGELIRPEGIVYEEQGLAYASNQLAKDGWEPVNLNSSRVLFRRAVAR